MRKTSALKWALVLLPLAYLWFRLINNLRLEWTTDPQYGYGLLVPFLCLGLLVRRWHGFSDSEFGVIRPPQWLYYGGSESRRATFSFPISVFQFFSLSVFLFGLAFLYLPTRLIEAAIPEWRPIQWLLGIEAIGLTLCAI